MIKKWTKFNESSETFTEEMAQGITQSIRYLRFFEDVTPKITEEEVTRYAMMFSFSTPSMMKFSFNKNAHDFCNKVKQMSGIDMIVDPSEGILAYSEPMKELTNYLNKDDELRKEFFLFSEIIKKDFEGYPDPLDLEDIFLDLIENNVIDTYYLSYCRLNEKGYMHEDGEIKSCVINITTRHNLEDVLNTKIRKIKSLLGFDFVMDVENEDITAEILGEYNLIWNPVSYYG